MNSTLFAKLKLLLLPRLPQSPKVVMSNVLYCIIVNQCKQWFQNLFLAAKPKKKAQKDSSSDDDISVDDEEEMEMELPASKTTHPAHAVKPNSRTKQPRSDRKKTPPPQSSEDENEDANESRKPRPSRSVAKSAKRPVMQPSDSEEEIFQKPAPRSKGIY